MEDDRLRRLIATGLLDSDEEARFDRLTRLASNALGAPIALISLIDSERQWFKSKVGLEAQETSREIAFCDHAIRKPNEVMVVLNAKDDNRFRDNPLVNDDPNIAFYAGAPLVTTEGHALGTLCVIDSNARTEFTETEKRILKDLARSVITEIEAAASKRQLDDLGVINQELQHRMGNLHAQVKAVVSLIGRDEADVKRFILRLNDNIQTMAQVQALFAANNYSAVQFSELVKSTLLPFDRHVTKDRMEFTDTYDLEVSERGAFLLTLVLNELAVNATKHGAWADEQGTVSIRTLRNGSITFSWQERFAPREQLVSQRKGFGSKILMNIAPRGLGGSATLDILPDGLQYSLTVSPQLLSSQ